jgi:hypothetical protein
MMATHNIETIFFEQNQICLKVDGQLIKLPIALISKKLEAASDLQRSFYTISPSGYGIHWPLIDEDLSVTSILKNI